MEGTDKGRIVLYSLSTCMWCRMAKNLLHDLGIG
jgi:glutaredoxin